MSQDKKKTEKLSWRKRISKEFSEIATWSAIEEAAAATGRGEIKVIKSMFD